MVSSYLEIPKEEAEIWIVNLIRNANIEAKIDSEKDIVVITRSRGNYYEEVKIFWILLKFKLREMED